VNVTALEQLGVALNSPTFRTLATIVLFILLILWFLNAGATLVGIFKGTIFGLSGGWREPEKPLLPGRRSGSGSTRVDGRQD
jgi:hypothetical protein